MWARICHGSHMDQRLSSKFYFHFLRHLTGTHFHFQGTQNNTLVIEQILETKHLDSDRVLLSNSHELEELNCSVSV